MATLAPVLGGNAAAFERPTQQGPSAAEGVASVIGSFVNAFQQPAPAAPRQPTQDELFGQAWSQFSESVGVALDPSNPQYLQNLRAYTPQFLRTYPEFAGQAGQLLRTQGVENTLTPQQQLVQQQEDSMVTFYGTPEGQLQRGLAIMEATSEDGTLDEAELSRQLDTRYAQDVQVQAELNRLAQEADAATDMSTVSTRMWEAYTPNAEDQVTAAMAGIFDYVNQMRLNPGGRIELDFLEAQQIGFLTSTITAENLPLVLQGYRNTLKQQIRAGLQGNPNVDPNRLLPPSEDWYNSVLSPFDAIIKTAEQDFGSLASTQSSIMNAGMIDARRRIQREDPALAAAISTLEILPQGVLQGIDLMSLGISEDLRDYMLLKNAADVPLDQRADAATNQSTADAQAAADFNIALLGSADLETANLTRAFVDGFASLDRVDPSAVLGKETWDAAVGRNAQQLTQAAQADPAFATVLQENLLSDVNKTLTSVMNGITGTVLMPAIAEDGTITVVPNEALIVQQLARRGYTQEANPAMFMQERENLIDLALAQGTDPNIALYNSKIATINTMNNIGAPIVDSILQRNAPFIVTGDGTDALGGGPAEDTISSSSSQSGQSVFNIPEHVSNDTPFVDAVFLTADRLGMNANDLLNIINFETGGSFDPAQANAAGSGATGLIQFMPSTAESLGTTTEALAGMTRVEQMKYVEDYLRPYAGRLNNFGDAYMAVLYPAAIGKSDDYVLFDGGRAYEQNAGLDIDGDGKVTRGEAVARAAQAAGVTNYQPSTTPVGMSPGLLATQTAPVAAPSRAVQAPVDSGVLRPRARPMTGSSEAILRPVARSNSSAQTTNTNTASKQATQASKQKALAVLLKNGFTREQLNAMGIT